MRSEKWKVDGTRPSATERADEFDILAFVVAADIVGLPHPTFGQDGVEGFGVIRDVEPVADVLTFAIDGDGLAAQAFEDNDGDEFLGKLIGAVVIGAVGDQNG